MNLTSQEYAELLARRPGLAPKVPHEAFKCPPERSVAQKGVRVACKLPGPLPGTKTHKKRLRQGVDTLNKWESEYLGILRCNPNLTPMPHAIKLQLASGCWYSPDIIVWDDLVRSLTAFEVKGFARDDAIVKLKVAARAYPFITFMLVWKEKGLWQQQQIIP